MTRMFGTIALLTVAASLGGYPDEVAAAKADYALRYAAGENPRYLDAGKSDDAAREHLVISLNFWLPHLSLGTVLEHQLPQRLGKTNLYRIDLDQLGWGTKAWIDLAKEYPYSSWVDPLIIRADWFLAITSDESESDQYSKLLFAKFGVPKNRNDFLKAIAFPREAEKFRAAIPIDRGKSGVADDTRLLAFTPAPSGYLFETFDSADAFGDQDPLENLAGGLKYDASEIIASIPKFSLKTGERGQCHAYMLTDGNEKRIAEAATNIVQDFSHFRSEPSIRTPGSCVSCHSALNGPKENTLREWIREGVEVLTKNRKTQEFIEQTYLSKIDKVLTRGNEDFETFCVQATGEKAPVCVNAFRNSVHYYDANVTLEQAAREVYAKDANEMKLAIALYSNRIGPNEGVGRLVSLAHERTVSRKTWEGDVKKKQAGTYHLAVEAMRLWQSRK